MTRIKTTTKLEAVKWTKEFSPYYEEDYEKYTYRDWTIINYGYEKDYVWKICDPDGLMIEAAKTVEEGIDWIDFHQDAIEEARKKLLAERYGEYIDGITKYAIDNYDAGWDFWVEMGDEDRLEIIEGAEAFEEAFKLALKYAGDEAEKRFCKADNASMFEWDEELYKELKERFNDFRKECA